MPIQALRIPIAILFLGWNIFFVKCFRIVLFFWRCLLIRIFLFRLFGRVPSGRASADYATLQNILRMVPLRVLRIPRAILFLGWNIFSGRCLRPGLLRARYSSVIAAHWTKPYVSLSHIYYVLYHKRLSRLVKPERRRPHSGKAQIKKYYNN